MKKKEIIQYFSFWGEARGMWRGQTAVNDLTAKQYKFFSYSYFQKEFLIGLS